MSRGPLFPVKVLLDVRSPMPDGVELSNDVYLPDADPPFPCILIRTPYGNNDPARKVSLARWFAARGYAVVVQDVRGRYDSDGVWEPFFNERTDGLATQEWLASQDFCDGSIVLMGRSYEGFCVWISAFDHHPAVKALVPIVPLPDPVVNVPWMNGSVFWNMITWALFVHGRTNQHVGQYDWESLYRFRPLDRLDERLGFRSPHWRAWMAHHLKDDYWKPACYMHRMAELDLPALHVCGWYDDDGISTYVNYPLARTLSRAADGQYLLVGPWPHATNTKTVVPGVDFGPEETIDLNGYILDWLDAVLGRDPSRSIPRARVFVMGSNTWRDLDDWPPPGTRSVPFYLASGGRANSLLGDGVLFLSPSDSSAAFDEYAYDPDNPTPYLYDAGTLQVGGPFDVRPIQRRDDVLCYTSPPLAEPLTICGRVSARLWVSSSAEDTEFCARLSVVFPNGEARQLCDGNVRLALRDSLERPDPVPPGETVEVAVDMWATSFRFSPGDRIRLDVASAALPKFAAHTNTLDPPGSAVRAVVARNRVHHSAARPSHLSLPVWEGEPAFREDER